MIFVNHEYLNWLLIESLCWTWKIPNWILLLDEAPPLLAAQPASPKATNPLKQMVNNRFFKGHPSFH